MKLYSTCWHKVSTTHWLALTLLNSLPAQKTAGGSTSETPAARPYTETQLTSSCPGSSAPPCLSQEASMPSHSPAADPALLTTFGQTPTLYRQTPCTTTPTSTPPPMNTTWEPRPGRRPILYPVSEDTRTITTWTPPQLTCTQPLVAPLIMTTGPDNDCCPPGLMAHSTAGVETGRKGSSVLSIDGLHNLRGAFTGWNSFLLDKPCRIYLKENASAPALFPLRGLLWPLNSNGNSSTPGHLLPARCRHWASEQRRQRDLSLTRTTPLITDWNRILFLCWMHFLICLVFIAFKKAICYIVHQPSR